MYRLEIFFQGRKVEKQAFMADDVVIGRAPECQVTLDNIGISRQHARIFRKGEFYVLKDLKSNNGTYVAGKRIDTHSLNDGDEITIGKFKIIFHRPLLISDSEAMPPKPKSVGGIMSSELTAGMDKEEIANAWTTAFLLELAEDKISVLKVHDMTGSHLVIGSGRGETIKAPGWRVDEKHAVIYRSEETFTILHVSSKGATYVNDVSVDSALLKSGDIISVGKGIFKFVDAREMQEQEKREEQSQDWSAESDE